MTDYKEVGKKTIDGKKRVIYKKPGSKKEYLKYKGRMMNIVKYKKMLSKKVEPKMKPVKKSKKSKTTKKYGKKRGGNSEQTPSDLLSESFNTTMKQINLLSNTAEPTTTSAT
jgi:hypothetical protein